MLSHLSFSNIQSFDLVQQPIITFIPFDNGSRIPGAKLAPTIVYQHLLNNNAINSFSSYKHCFTIPVLSNNSALSYQNIEDWFGKLISNKNFPLTLGGDHSIVLPIINSITRDRSKKVNVLLFDAHHDLDKAPTLKNWNVVHEISKVANKVIILGCRSNPIDNIPENVKLLTMDDFDKSTYSTIIDNLTCFLDKSIPLYLSVDLDVLDPSEFPGVSYPIPGGLTFRELKRMLKYLLESYNISAVDLVEYNPMIEQTKSLVIFEHLLLLLDNEWKHV